MAKVRCLTQENCDVVTSEGVVKLGPDGWVLNQNDFSTKFLLGLPEFEDGDIFTPRRERVLPSSHSEDLLIEALFEIYKNPEYYSDGKISWRKVNECLQRIGFPPLSGAAKDSILGRLYNRIPVEETLKSLAAGVRQVLEKGQE